MKSEKILKIFYDLHSFEILELDNFRFRLPFSIRYRIEI